MHEETQGNSETTHYLFIYANALEAVPNKNSVLCA